MFDNVKISTDEIITIRILVVVVFSHNLTTTGLFHMHLLCTYWFYSLNNLFIALL